MTARLYVAIDIDAQGRSTVDQFRASSDTAAARKAQFAAEGVALELWCADEIVGRWVRSEKRSFAPVAVPIPKTQPRPAC